MLRFAKHLQPLASSIPLEVHPHQSARKNAKNGPTTYYLADSYQSFLKSSVFPDASDTQNVLWVSRCDTSHWIKGEYAHRSEQMMNTKMQRSGFLRPDTTHKQTQNSMQIIVMCGYLSCEMRRVGSDVVQPQPRRKSDIHANHNPGPLLHINITRVWLC